MIRHKAAAVGVIVATFFAGAALQTLGSSSAATTPVYGCFGAQGIQTARPLQETVPVCAAGTHWVDVTTGERQPPTTTTVAPTTASTTTRPTTTTASTPTTFILDSSFNRPSKSDPDYRQKVDFTVRCAVSSVATDDPIVFPNQPGKSHVHVFTGNVTTNAASTQQSLDVGGTNCALDRDRAAYWIPRLYAENGTPVDPYLTRAYYRAGSLNPVGHIPHGLKIIAGNGLATTPQDAGIAGWQCRQVSPDVNTVKKQATIPTCASKDLLEASVIFPNCWDGVNLDSADHKSHMSYSDADGNEDNCDAAHPVQLPQLTLAYRYSPGKTNSRSYLASGNSGLTLHADFWNAWHQPTLDVLVDRCINAGVHCGGVSPSHFPGPMP